MGHVIQVTTVSRYCFAEAYADMSRSSNHTKAFVQCCHGKHTVASSWTFSDRVYLVWSEWRHRAHTTVLMKECKLNVIKKNDVLRLRYITHCTMSVIL